MSTTTIDGVDAVKKTRRRRTVEERRQDLANRLAKLENREGNRDAKRLTKILEQMRLIHSGSGNRGDQRLSGVSSQVIAALEGYLSVR